MLNRYYLVVLSSIISALVLSSCQVKKAEDILKEVNSGVVDTNIEVGMKISDDPFKEKAFDFNASYFSKNPFFVGRLNGFSDFLDEKSFNQKIDYPVDNKYVSPLSLVDLSKIKLLGTIMSDNERLALVEYADKVFFMRRGNRLGKGDGIISLIGNDFIHVYQQKDDGTGRNTNEKVIIRSNVAKEDRGSMR